MYFILVGFILNTTNNHCKMHDVLSKPVVLGQSKLYNMEDGMPLILDPPKPLGK